MTDRTDARSAEVQGHDPAELQGVTRFGVRAALGWVAVLVGALPFLLLWVSVRDETGWLAEADAAIAQSLNDIVSESPLAVDVLALLTRFGDTSTKVLVFVCLTLFLAIRRHWRLAAFSAVTGIGLAVLVPTTKAIIDRARPDVASPVVEMPVNASFPSGHSMGSLVTYTALLLVVLPSVRRAWRPWLVAATVVLVITVGFTRMALGVHFLTDVLAGWTLGVAWLAVTVLAFRAWEGRRTLPVPPDPVDPLHPARHERAHLAPIHTDRRDAHAVLVRLAAGAVAVYAVLAVLGLVVTGLLGDTAITRFDRAAVRWADDLRGSSLGAALDWLGYLSGSRAVIGVGILTGTVALAFTRSWRPVLFVGTAILGEVLLYVTVRETVGRGRPEVSDLTAGLPTQGAWPSGHVAAATVLYGAVAVLVITYLTHPARWAVLALPLLVVPVVALSRVYVAAHYPTDTLAGLLLGAGWLAVCTHVLLRSHSHASRRQRQPVRPDSERVGPG